MSEINTTAPRQQRSYAAQVLREVFMQWGARLGIAWIVVLVTVAVFAPFLASSYPLLLSEQSQISSPLLHHLTATDVTLLIIFFVVLLLCFVRISFRRKFVAALLIGSVAATLCYSLIAPPQLNIYEQYREQERAAGYDWLIRAPIPYSAKDYLRDVGDSGLKAPLSATQQTHWFGTDENGADVLSRMIHASRIALSIGFVATGIAMVLGTIIGGLMGYFSGIFDMIGMRLVEIFEAIPVLFLLLTFVAFFGRNLYVMMIIIGITGWTGYARFVRAEFLKLRQQEFVQAAIACGLPLRSILFRHFQPNGMAPIL
ncbi:MAG: ABC transporter permease, partial [Pseudomonadota bacterium]|nr:ABC transporter permease [Pseudomonadota bacterium]